MKHTRVWAWALTPVLVLGALTALSAARAPARAGGITRQIPSGGTTSIKLVSTGSGAIEFPEFIGQPRAEGAGADAGAGAAAVNRSLTTGTGQGAPATPAAKGKANVKLVRSFDGLNHRAQRTANGGNQFSLEPPDQGLCVGNGFVLETVNNVLRVYDTVGNPVTGVTDQNTFYGYPPAINRTTGAFGPFITDPSCFFDTDTQRWFLVVLTLDVDPANGAFLGPNHLDLAVSKTSSPTGAYTIYRIPVQDDGTQGTPNHHCELGPCIGDYPHIGADANGFYITTNEYPFFPPTGFHAAQVYAISKAALAASAANITVTQFDTIGSVAGNPGFTIWPATTPAGAYATDLGGTEYFLSSMAAEEANGNGSDNRIALWALTNTSSLNGTPALSLRNAIVPVTTYSIPPKADQKVGDFPLGQCVNDTTTPTPFGPGCWQLLFVDEPAHNEVEGPLDSNDTRMQQVVYANGKVWGALDTAVSVGGATKAGVAFYVLTPQISSTSLAGKLVIQGQFGVAGNNLVYPAVGVTNSGRGVIAMTLAGADHYPTAAFAGLDAKAGVGPIQIAKEGVGPEDGFCEYNAFNCAQTTPPAAPKARPRWGDYGATAIDGNNIWIASEYINQTCTLTQWLTAPIGSCGATRTALANWGTRISLVTP